MHIRFIVVMPWLVFLRFFFSLESEKENKNAVLSCGWMDGWAVCAPAVRCIAVLVMYVSCMECFGRSVGRSAVTSGLACVAVVAAVDVCFITFAVSWYRGFLFSFRRFVNIL